MKRGSIRAPRFVQADLVVAKKFGITDGRAFEFRWEVYNIFDRTNFANPPAQIVDDRDGRESGAAGTAAHTGAGGLDLRSAELHA
jgi:hypothetical protein